MREDPRNLCGVWPVILKGSIFTPACEWHDEAYTIGSFFQRENWTRKQVDEWFYYQMLRIANSPWDRIQAHIFYGIVRAVGAIWWEGRK